MKGLLECVGQIANPNTPHFQACRFNFRNATLNFWQLRHLKLQPPRVIVTKGMDERWREVGGGHAPRQQVWCRWDGRLNDGKRLASIYLGAALRWQGWERLSLHVKSLTSAGHVNHQGRLCCEMARFVLEELPRCLFTSEICGCRLTK